MCVKTAAAIDYAHCGINDVIAHSLKLHPELLADCIRSHAGVHAEFADAYEDREVTQNELDLADRLHAFANSDRRSATTRYLTIAMCAARRSAVRRGCKICTRSCRGRWPSEKMCGMRVMPEAAELRQQANDGRHASNRAFLWPRQPGAKWLSSSATTSRSQRCAGS